MKSKRAREYLIGKVAAFMYPGEPEECDLKLKDAKHAVEIAEEDMAEKAGRVFSEYLSGAHPEDIIKKNVEEFKQKMMNI